MRNSDFGVWNGGIHRAENAEGAEKKTNEEIENGKIKKEKREKIEN